MGINKGNGKVRAMGLRTGNNAGNGQSGDLRKCKGTSKAKGIEHA